ncbi:MAG TPA: SDR family oxidoreductase [Solirubrobacterales bacterium]|nr:SDR family oxidoreductase [Solirubrobacterales bacterium]
MSDLEGKVVLITGTARGCGQVLAEAFAGAGAEVVACDRDAEAGAQVAERIRAAGGEIDFSHADVSVEGEVERLVPKAIDRHRRLDVAVNNAGTESTAQPAAGTEAAFDDLIANNLKGLFFCLKHEIAAMRSGGGGAIVNMSSVTSSMTAVPAEQLATSFPVGHMGRPEELVAAVMYLSSDEARYCTGTTLVLDGGYTAQ